MVGQTRGPSRPGAAPPRSFQPISPPPSEAARSSTVIQPESEMTPEPSYTVSNEASIAEEETNNAPAGDSPVPKSQSSSSSSSNPSYTNQKIVDSKQTNVKLLNSDMTRYVKKVSHISNSQILSIVPSGKTIDNVKQGDKSDACVSANAKRNENQPNFITMQQKINEKLLANQIPIQRLPEQQIILKQVNTSDNIVAMTTAKIPAESNQNYFAMLTNKPQTNYLNYVSLPVNQQNFITVDQQQKSNFVVMEAQSKANLVTVPQKSTLQSSGQTYLVHGNGADLKQFNSYLAVTTKPGDTNGTTFFTMTPTKHNSGSQTTYLMTPKQSENSRTFVAVTQKANEATYLALPAGKTAENNKTATFIAMEPNKSDTNIIVTQVLPSSQHFQLEYAEGEANKTGRFNARDNAVVQPVVPKLSCSAVSSGSGVLSTKTAVTNTLPTLSNAGSTKKNGTTSKVLTSSSASSNKTAASPQSGNIYITTSANVTFLQSPNIQTLASSNIAPLVTNSGSDATAAAEAEEPEAKPAAEESNSTSTPSPNLSVPVSSVLNSNVPHSHQYLIPNMDNLKLAADNMNKMMPPQSNPPAQAPKAKSSGVLKLQSDQNFQMHNYSKNDSVSNSLKKPTVQENSRKKVNQIENNRLSGKNNQKYVYSNYQRNDVNQNYGSGKSRMETRPSNHQRMNDSKNPEVKSYRGKNFVKEEVKAETDAVDVKVKVEDEDEEEGVEVRPVFDIRIPLVFQVVLTDHSYGLPMLVVRDEKPPPVEEDKESVISSDGKGEDGEETETAAEGEDSITRCICDLEHDDGYMVCCDKCSVWQHVACVFPDVRAGTPLPEEYLCDACHPRKLDRNRARALQLQRRKQIFNNSESSDSSSSSLEIASSASTGSKRHGTIARRRAEPVPRKPMKLGKSDSSEPVLKNTTAVKARRRDPTLKTAPQIRRRTKLRKKIETKLSRAAVRRKSKNKETTKGERESSLGGQKDEKNDGMEDSNRKSPDLRTRLQIMRNSGIRELNVKHTRVRCRIGHLPDGEAILLASCNLTKGQLIVEIRGKFLFSDEQPGKSECLFFYRFPKDGSEIVVDASGEENMVRSARRSCRPNTQMKHCIVKGSLRLYLIATEDLNKNQELTIAHNSISDNSSQKEGCVCRSRECPFAVQKQSQNVSHTERRRRGRRRTVSDESEGSPVKNKKENISKSQAEQVRKNSSFVQSNRSPCSPVQPETRVDKDRKLTRDERKIEQAMKIFAQMERDTARKKDKDRPQLPLITSRKESHLSSKADSDKESPVESNKSRRRRRRRRRRSRKARLPSGASAISVTQFNSGDSDMSSADELPSPRRKAILKDSRDSDLQSPTDKNSSPRIDKRRDSCSSRDRDKRNDAAGLLLALGLSGQKTPTREKESENEGSPPTPLSSACLLVAAAVGPLAPGFRFPKTKKGLMNEWLNKSPEHSNQEFSPSVEVPLPSLQAESSLPPGAPKLSNLSNRLFSPIGDDKSLDLKVDPIKDPRILLDGRTPSGTPAGFGKKRWLRQAISEECDAPQGQGSPPCPPDNVTPLKKRRLARESLSSDPPTTPPMPHITSQSKDEPMYGGDINSPESPAILDTENEISLAERVDALRREYMEAQERNLLKDYDYNRENQMRARKESESYDRFNSYYAQRSPENLTFRYPDTPYYQESSQPNEKPLDLTGEKEKLGTSESENERNDSSPKHSRKCRGKKTAGKSEVRTSPRFRKPAKGRKAEGDGESESRDDSRGEGGAGETADADSTRQTDREGGGLDVVKDEFYRSDIVNLDDKNKVIESNPSTSNSTSANDVDASVKCDVVVKEEEEEEEGTAAEGAERFSKPEFFSAQKEDDDSRDGQEEKVLRNGYAAVKSEAGLCKNEDSDLSGKCTPVNENVKSEIVFENSSESHRESKIEDLENDSFSSEKAVPIKRKLSITEYLRRKKCNAGSTKKSHSTAQINEEDGVATNGPHSASPQVSPSSDEEKSRVSLLTPVLPPVFLEIDKSLEKPGSGVRFKPEPTELERQRENLTERLRREFGLLISDDDPKPVKPTTEDAASSPPGCPYPGYHRDSTDFLDSIGKSRSLYHPPSQPLPQSAIYPVGSSNPPNPSCIYSSPYSTLPPSLKHEEKREDKKMKKFKQ
ncbi:UNVERIFIED_CONTAM: hypothetical protein PYX00_004343 [Menopon gallinae]|uniref:SET domain-containing protein n=1 Tax=Menopon gallinae TaxID=328185 RepID=A0AAW2I439_9NEOP